VSPSRYDTPGIVVVIVDKEAPGHLDAAFLLFFLQVAWELFLGWETDSTDFGV
jgi:hypothetical protein